MVVLEEEKLEIETPEWVEAVENIEGVSYVEDFEEDVENTMETIDEESIMVPRIEEPEIVFVTETPFIIEKINYSSMTVRELQEYCRERGVKVSGTKAEVVLRLNRHDDGIMEDTANSVSEAPSEEAADVEPEAPSEEAVEETLDAPVEETAVTDGEANEYSKQRRIIDEEE